MCNSNARRELENFLTKHGIDCKTGVQSAQIIWGDNPALLREGYSQTDLEEFLKRLDFEYNFGYGIQFLYGTMWFRNGDWAERREYDGQEWWSYVSRPKIPYHLLHPKEEMTSLIVKSQYGKEGLRKRVNEMESASLICLDYNTHMIFVSKDADLEELKKTLKCYEY